MSAEPEFRPQGICRGGFVVAGGGTAGHVLPGLAVAEALVSTGVAAGRHEVHMVGSRRGIEVDLVPAAGFGLTVLPGRGIRRRLTPANVVAVLGLLVGMFRAVLLLARHRPRAVVSLGGYASVPCGVAAVLLRIPLVVAEQNAVPGAANRLLGRFARACAISFPNTDLPRAELTGNPVRSEVRSLVGRSEEARRSLGLDDRPLVVAFGGSLGARRLNRAVVDLVEGWTSGAVVIRHVVGPRGWSAGEQASECPAGVDYRPVDYEHDLPTVLAAADLVICRSGATTVSELAVLGVPAVLVPLPGAPGDHQTANARHHADAGGGVFFEDDRLKQGDLADLVALLLADPGKRRAMSVAASAASKPDAAERVAGIIAHHAASRREDEPYG